MTRADMAALFMAAILVDHTLEVADAAQVAREAVSFADALLDVLYPKTTNPYLNREQHDLFERAQT